MRRARRAVVYRPATRAETALRFPVCLTERARLSRGEFQRTFAPGGLFFLDERGTFDRMNKTVIEVQVRAVLPTSGGCAVFLGNSG